MAKIRAVVVDDSEGIADRLDRELAESKAASKHPWKEMVRSRAANQFATLLPVISRLKMLELTMGPPGADSPRRGRSFVAGGEKVAVFCTRGGQVFAVQAECPYIEGHWRTGLLGSTTLICPLHGWKFDLSTGKPLMGDCAIKTFPVRVDEAGQIMLTVDET